VDDEPPWSTCGSRNLWFLDGPPSRRGHIGYGDVEILRIGDLGGRRPSSKKSYYLASHTLQRRYVGLPRDNQDGSPSNQIVTRPHGLPPNLPGSEVMRRSSSGMLGEYHGVGSGVDKLTLPRCAMRRPPGPRTGSFHPQGRSLRANDDETAIRRKFTLDGAGETSTCHPPNEDQG
jgi:hypothetical protein